MLVDCNSRVNCVVYGFGILGLILLLLVVAACISPRPSSSPAPVLNSGACGYGSLAIGFNGGHLAAAVPSIFKDGAGCGACFQVGSANWGFMSRKFSAVWDTCRVPERPLQFRLIITAGFDGKYLWAKNV